MSSCCAECWRPEANPAKRFPRSHEPRKGEGGGHWGIPPLPHELRASMKLTIERAALLRALGHVQSVVERRNTIPILSNVMLRAQKGKLSLAATDMDIEIVESV